MPRPSSARCSTRVRRRVRRPCPPPSCPPPGPPRSSSPRPWTASSPTSANAAPKDVMMLLESELDDYVVDPARVAPVIAGRLPQYLALFEIEPPFIIDADPALLSSWPRRARPQPEPAKPGDVLTGIGGSAGQYEGTARVGMDLPAAMALEPGEVPGPPPTDAAP